MSKRTTGVMLIILGVVLVIVSLAADVIGIGNETGIGWKQILGAVVGFLIAVAGLVVALYGASLASRKAKQ